ncbi:hypothetical protein BDD12DRAFT_883685 [Trichophaea hybrida]|nr:hypothetical protein BDD12DRAFT_883685 [Trichophaea hybrida]
MPTPSDLATQQETLLFPRFTVQDVFDIGCDLRAQALVQYPNTPVAIRISSPSGQILFATVSRSGTFPDSESWLSRKAATVFRHGCSTLYMGEKLRAQGLKGERMSENFPVDEVYACHGGGFPVRIEGVEEWWPRLW